MRFAVKIEGKERIVELDEGAKPRVDDVEWDVEVVEAERGLWVLRRDGEQTVVSVDGVGAGAGAKLTVEIRRPGADPLVLAAEVTDARRAPGA